MPTEYTYTRRPSKTRAASSSSSPALSPMYMSSSREVVSNPRDGVWILLRYLTGPDPSAQRGGEELVFAENIVELL
jgi:hypothetical protein